MKLAQLQEARYQQQPEQEDPIASIRVYTGEEEGGWVGVDINEFDYDQFMKEIADGDEENGFRQVQPDEGMKEIISAAEHIASRFLNSYDPEHDLWNEDPDGNPPVAELDDDDIKQFMTRVRQLNLHKFYYYDSEDDYFPQAMLVAI